MTVHKRTETIIRRVVSRNIVMSIGAVVRSHKVILSFFSETIIYYRAFPQST